MRSTVQFLDALAHAGEARPGAVLGRAACVDRYAIGLGGNVGDVRATIASAVEDLAALPTTLVEQISELVRTPAMTLPGSAPQADYLNGAAVIRSVLSPRVLLAHLHEIERRHGRRRDDEPRWSPRTLDLDLLLHRRSLPDGRSVDLSHANPPPMIPHPGVCSRLFVLGPLATVAPDWRVPTEHGLSAPIVELLGALGSEAPRRGPSLGGGTPTV